MATNPSMSGSRAARETSILVRLRELQTSLDALSADGVAKAWVTYDQIGDTVLDSFNVDDVTDNSDGVFTVIWTTDFDGTNYGTWINGKGIAAATSWHGKEAHDSPVHAEGSCKFLTQHDNGTSTDFDLNSVLAFGDQ